MLKKTVKYDDFDGEKREEDLWFHLTKAEIMAAESENSDGFISDFNRSLATGDNRGIYRNLTFLIRLAYGERDEVSGKFIKTRNGQRIYKDFEVTEAYSTLIDNFLDKPDTILDFFNEVLPKKMIEEAQKEIAAREKAATPQLPE